MIGPTIDAIARLTPVPLFAASLATGALLFASDGLADQLRLAAFRNEYGGWIGATFLIASAFFLAQMSARLAKWGMEKRSQSKQMKVRIEWLHELTPPALGYLVPYVHDGVESQVFPIGDGTAGALLAADVLFRSSNIITTDGESYGLQPWARRYLLDHPELLENAVPPTRQRRW